MTDLSSTDLGTAINKLSATIDARSGADPKQSYTSKLLHDGVAHCAKKLGEEAVELVIASTSGDAQETSKEAADVLYHLLVVLKAAGVNPADVAAVLAEREKQSGLEEKASRPK